MTSLANLSTRILPSRLRDPLPGLIGWCGFALLTAPWWMLSVWYVRAVVIAVTVGLGMAGLERLYLRLCGVQRAEELPRADQRPARRALLSAALGLGVFALAALPMLPRAGVRTQLRTESGNTIEERTTEPGVLPVNWLTAANIFKPMVIEQRGWIHVPGSGAPQLQLSATHGETVLEFDGEELTRITGEPPLRMQVLSLLEKPGVHRVVLRTKFEGPVPGIGLRLVDPETSTILDWRLHFSVERAGGLLLPLVMRGLLWGCLGLAAMLALAVTGVRFAAAAEPQRLARLARWRTAIVIVAALAAAIGFRALAIDRSGGVLDADEAAFGIMADRLLEGEFPPLYHYGQNYQGTLEAWTMAALFQFTSVSASALRWHPFLWYLLGVALLMALAARDFRLGTLVALGAYLAVSPQLLTWMSTKAWFGYDSTWALGAGALLVAVWIARQPDGRVWRWGLWGMLAGLAFYTLPLVTPFLIVSAIVMARACSRQLIGRGGLALAAGLLAGLVPMFLYDLSTGGLAALFVLKGRELGQARAPGELPFVDRFLGECLPVLLGTRPVHEDRMEHVNAAAAMVVYVLFWLGCVRIAPRIWRDTGAFWKEGSLSSPLVFAMLMAASIVVGVYGSFGIWPWYFLAIYPCLALILYEGIRSISTRIPLAAPVLWLVVIGVNASGTLQAAPFMHQPTSLLKQGVLLASNHSELLQTLEERDIHSVICDQGMDFSETVPGRDWLGERIAFESRGAVNAIDLFSRRHKHLAQRLHSAPRIAYLFHRKLLWWDADPARIGESDKSPITFQRLAALFGPKFADYERTDIGSYALFTPRPGASSEVKALLTASTSKSPHLTGRILDGGVGSRDMSYAYWATGLGGQQKGDFVKIDLERERHVRGLVLYHGVKGYDRPGRSRVELSSNGQPWRPAGHLDWYAEANASVWRIAEPTAAQRIRVTLEEDRPETWWTIYEAWVVDETAAD